ncbi:MAG: penicillin-binding protein [Bdellovibrionota bacterium]
MDKNFRIRLGVCLLLIGALGAGVMVRAALLMLVPSERLTTAMNRQFRTEPPRLPRRGYILDRNKEPIAVSMDVKSLFVNPGKVKNKAQVAFLLSRILKFPASVLRTKLNSDRGFVWIKRQLSETEQTAVDELLDRQPSLSLSLGLSKESKRFYPNQSLAAQALGFTGLDSNGLEGVELFYEKELAGNSDPKSYSDGRTLVLTIDKALQYTLEEELARGMRDTGGIAATGIVMDADNGDILAMASAPSFNANRFGGSNADARRNRSVTDTYEPGSTMKPVMVAGALDEGVITPKTKVFCEYGKYQIGKHWINESEAKDKWGWLHIGEVLQKSSNIGATKIGFLYGPERLFSWLKKMGISEKTGVDLPGETSGSLARAEKWSKIAQSNISFGQGISVTPLQVVRAYAAIANGGYLVKPRIVKQLYTFEGEMQKELKPATPIQVMKKQSAEAVAAMLASVPTEDGTAPKAAIPGFVVAGKTGTAQKPIPGKGYKTGKYMSSFVGFARNVKPNYVTLILVDEPKFPYFGGETAAPIFRRVMTAALAREGISPDATLIQPEFKMGKRHSLPMFQEKITAMAAAPEAPKDLAKADDYWMMPNLTGLTARDVMDLFSSKDLQLQLRGSGLVKTQRPPVGALLKKGDLVLLRLERDTALP